MPKFFIKTYGCQMNERDAEQVAHSLMARGYERVSKESEADVVLLNTCSVRDMADQKALGKMGMLGRLAKERPHVVFGFLGCMAQARGDELLKGLSHVDLVVGTQKFHRVADYVEELVAKKAARTECAFYHSSQAMDDLRFSIVDVAEERGSQSTIRDQSVTPGQATAFVSIMQGCNMHCTFCIVPQTRGMERSRSINDIVSEVRDLVSRGVKEITLLGQIVNLYGRHEFPKIDNKSPFVQLLEAVDDVNGLERLRFTSPHPIGFRDDLIDAISRLPKLAEHVHLPLQSGSNKILKTMHRAYTAEKYLDLVRRIRRARDGIAITTDIIVGFPGETEDDYKQTRDLVDKIQFDNAFVFRYSPRRGTPAADMLDQIEERTREERNQDLLQVVNVSNRRSLERLVGQCVEVLCEGPSKTNPARLMGRTRTNKIVVFEGSDRLIGELVKVRIEQANGFSLYGTPIREAHVSGVLSLERKPEACATLASF
ncbi:MAG: tRNA (N6-isopentenyl adenosine(37)-C2)-methylthiotransferase MiaB [Verrucomicrobia bacterium]|nr:MAG: tRNA (N6-isopentenyl adenosine(37)-C2)-methylthiotransferase MiaB [Verrucomicrobia bacterium 13_2_20CM_55_10]OLB17894.1 MAG: tRNA (N6-isopentenyl adenosine(37)-C2)-methylthiotransferase MiaB [Verrucomicrobia bacterium 13_2_20CM_2_54_15_9cls]PYI40648.1 MAG: tRNA (N6-isopentenyl adenosine(37)-C2)-methylthiotransferase MiaB [Verrucomicrobiota bacterium]